MSAGARVLVCTDLFWPYTGGIEVLLARLLPELAEQGHELMVLTSREDDRLPERDAFRGIPIERLPLRPALHSGNPAQVLAVSRRVDALVKEFQPGILHLHGLGLSGFFQARAAGNHRAPLVVSIHLDLTLISIAEQSTCGELLRRADWVTVVSRSVHDQLVRLEPSIAARSSVILNAAPMPDELPLPLPFDPPRLLCLGRLVEQKGFDVAIDALSRIRSRHPGVRLEVVGFGDPAELKRDAARLGVIDSVDFRPPVPPKQVFGLINQSTIVLMPSRHEGFGLVALEAAQMGRPVIGTNIPGLVDVVVDGETGLLVPKEDASALAAAIERLLQDSDLSRRLGAAARSYVTKKFSWDACVSAYDALYRQFATA